MPQATPVSTSQRLETLDVLRGFALLGILGLWRSLTYWRRQPIRRDTSGFEGIAAGA